MSAVLEAKSRLTIHDLAARLLPDWKPGKSCRCPWREDRNPSFSVSQDGRLWNDFSASEGGDAVDFLAQLRGCSVSEAAREFIALAGVQSGEAPTPAPLRPPQQAERMKPDLPLLDEGSPEERRQLARLRNLSPESIAIAIARGLLRFADSSEGRAWVLTDQDRWAAQARRLDGERWKRLSGSPKAWTLPGSRASWPLGFSDAIRRRRVAFVEGSPDALAAIHHAWASSCEEEIGVCAMIGASCRIPDECLAPFAGTPVRVFVHADEAGLKAARRWAAQLHKAGARVSGFDFTGMLRDDGSPVNDLCDMASVSPDSWEEHRALIENAMRF